MPTLYAARDGNWTGSPAFSDLYTVNPATGVPTSIGPTGFAITTLAFDPTTGFLYASTSPYSGANPKSLIRINPATGAGTLIGAFGLAGSFDQLELAFTSGGVLYGYNSNPGDLYTINKATGAATLVATTPGSSPFFPDGIEFDAAGTLYGFLFTYVGAPFGVVDTATAVVSQWADIVASPIPAEIITDVAFDGSGVLWCIAGFSENSLLTLAPDGTLTLVGVRHALGMQNDWSALAWDSEAKPNPWKASPTTCDNFNVAPDPLASSCSTPVGALISSDGSVGGFDVLKIKPAAQDSFLRLPLPIPYFSDDEWIFTSFALYIPSWASMWAGGLADGPACIGLRSSGVEFSPTLWLQSTSPTTGELQVYGQSSGGPLQAVAVADGVWLAVEWAYRRRTGANREQSQIWVGGADQGLVTGGAFGLAPSAIWIGDDSWGGFGIGPDDLDYYVGKFCAGLQRLGPVDLTGATFGGIGSGTDTDACTGVPLSAHPNDDAYSTQEGHPLTVGAPGVMANDVSPTTVSLVSGSAHGTVVLNSDGSFVYSPDDGYLGTDSFVYAGNGGTATVTITMLTLDARAIFGGGSGSGWLGEQ